METVNTDGGIDNTRLIVCYVLKSSVNLPGAYNFPRSSHNIDIGTCIALTNMSGRTPLDNFILIDSASDPVMDLIFLTASFNVQLNVTGNSEPFLVALSAYM